MGIYRVKYHTTIPVGSGGRITVPQEMRDDLNLDDGDTLMARLEEDASTQRRQITLWKSEET